MEDQQESSEAVYCSRDKRRCLERTLVLEAAGIESDLRRASGEYTILVTKPDADRARAELDAYDHDDRTTPRRVLAFPHHAGGWVGVYGFVAVLLLVDVLRDRDVFASDWFTAGRTHADLIRQGQWWRAVTALCLHSDLPHLLGNIVVGSLFGLLAAQLLGSGLAWLSILCGGAAGNVVNAWIQHSQHTSVGASTAVFAALGIVVAYVWTGRRHSPASVLRRWAPLIVGGVLLGYFGAGGPRTDVSAHAAGFFCGLLLGAVHGKLGNRAMFAAGGQFALGTIAIALLVLAWTIALLSSGT